MKNKVVLDFDNTMGVQDCDVDDGLALLHLLGQNNVEIVGVCTSYGNSTIDVVHDNTRRLLETWQIDLPVYRGASGPDNPESEAAEFLAAQATSHPGEINVLVTGSTTNLYGAAILAPEFFQTAKHLYFMGGIERSLVINGRIMDELNFSCDPSATALALSSGCPTTVATAQACLDAFFAPGDFQRMFGEESWLCKTCLPWFKTMQKWYEWDGFACWDVVAAACLTHPELFKPRALNITMNSKLLELGYLEQAEEGAPNCTINAPTIADPRQFASTIAKSWQQGMEKLPGLRARS